MTRVEVALGPPAIARIAQAVQTLDPLLMRGALTVHPRGGLEFFHEEAAAAALDLQRAVEGALPDEVMAQVGLRSGLGWQGFFGHVLGWWANQRPHAGFLRALVDRAGLHQVELSLRWNEGRQVSPLIRPVGNGPLVWGTVAGAFSGWLLVKLLRIPSLVGFLVCAAGLVIGRLVQRRTVDRRCGDHLCRAPLPARAVECPSCGAVLVDAPLANAPAMH